MPGEAPTGYRKPYQRRVGDQHVEEEVRRPLSDELRGSSLKLGKRALAKHLQRMGRLSPEQFSEALIEILRGSESVLPNAGAEDMLDGYLTGEHDKIVADDRHRLPDVSRFHSAAASRLETVRLVRNGVSSHLQEVFQSPKFRKAFVNAMLASRISSRRYDATGRPAVARFLIENPVQAERALTSALAATRAVSGNHATAQHLWTLFKRATAKMKPDSVTPASPPAPTP